MVVDDVDLVRHGGRPVTSLVRTVFDCARTLRPLEGLVVADAALRRGIDRRHLDGLLAGPPRRGLVRARAIVALADGGAESPGESATRFAVLRHGLPAPTTQVLVRTRLGTFRADMGWLDGRLLVEFDGFVKNSALASGDPARVVFDEKRRQEAIEEEGWKVLRVTASDLRDEKALIARIRRFVPRGVAVRTVRRPELWGR